MIKINGKEENEALGKTISNYLTEKGYKLTFIAVEVNGNILPKNEYNTYTISDSDVIEVVNFVGGG
ncbi:MAG: sulfur carrier protein ThiS [Lachnospirales bacterium]